ncbi:MAG TPA: hypothetical protein VEX67_00545 [Solirubrobacteraceae bacterium]|nr:hypothetical protein [Solirubrobacteraceae bacterium]
MRIPFDRRAHHVAAAVAAMAGLALLAAAPAQAQSQTSAVCTITLSASITPPFHPLVLVPASGTVSSGGQTLTVTCLGAIDGDRITGPGTGALVYAYSNGTCVAHNGLGTVTWTIPTEAGPKQLTGTLTVRRIGLGVLAEVRFANARAVLAGALVPLAGDCVLTPLRRVGVTVAGLLTGT